MPKIEYGPALKAEYEALYANAAIRPEALSDVDFVVTRIMKPEAWEQYQDVEHAIGVPAHVVGIIHIREASGNFREHLHNGDPLSARTVHVPVGRPPTGHPPFPWVESAVDALTMPGQTLDQWHDWSIAGTAFVLERYNGFGYRSHGINSPYLWGGTTAYERGMYVADGQWSGTAVNKNPGGMAMLKRMIERGLVSLDVPAVSPPPADPVALIKEAQTILGVVPDGDPGPLTRAALAAWRVAHPG